MNLEENIKDVITKKIEEGLVEKLIEEHFEKGVSNALENLFRSYGDITRLIEKKIKAVMVPYIEEYDYSEYITKLDSVMVEVLKHSTHDNQKILHNFKQVMSPEESKTVNLSELFAKWADYVSESVETDGLEVNFDDEPYYEAVEVTLDVEYNERRDWLKHESALILLECPHDEDMNAAIPIYRFTDISDKWTIDYTSTADLKSLRYLSSFEVYIMKLDQLGIKLSVDVDYDSESIVPKEQPEANFY